MGHEASSELVISKTTEIMIAYLGVRGVEPDQLPGLVQAVRAALGGGGASDSSYGAAVAPPVAEAGEAERPQGAARHLQAVPSVPPLSPPEDGSVRRPVSVEESVTRDYLICMEDGKHYRSLRRHLMAKYQMTPDDYRRKWALPRDYPMVAPSYAEERSLVARRSGLGTKGPVAEDVTPRHGVTPKGRKASKA